VRCIKRIAAQMNKWRNTAHQWFTEETLVLYNHIVNRFQFKLRNGKSRSRFNEFSWCTIVNLVRNHKGVLVGEDEDEPIKHVFVFIFNQSKNNRVSS